MPWFPHDTEYGGDPDIEIMIANYGQDGYAYPLHMYELAYRTRDGELSISDAEKRKVYAKNCLVPPERWEEMTRTALKYGIWDKKAYKERQVLTSNRIKESMRPVLEHRERAKKSYYEKKGQKPPSKSAAEKPQTKRRNDTEKSRVEDKNKRKKTPPSPEALRLAGVLANQIIRRNPNNRELGNGKKEASITRWARDIDIMLNRDKREPGDIQRVILWAHQESKFWYQNILSGASLKTKYDQMVLQMRPATPHKVDESQIDYNAVARAEAAK
jgi:hypothetical protein